MRFEDANNKFNFSVPLENIRDTIELVRIHHNEFLDYALDDFEKIKNGDNEGINWSWQMHTILLAQSFFSEKGWSIENYDTNSMLDTMYTELIYIIENDTLLSIEGKNFLRRLDTITNDFIQNECLFSYISKCNQIIDMSLSLSDKLETLIVGTAASIAKNSATYWSDSNRIIRFRAMCEPRNKSMHQNGNKILGLNAKQERLLKSDIAGAVEGAITGAIVGTSLGGGIGAVALAPALAAIRGGQRSLLRAIMEEVYGGPLPWWLDWI